jgi:hypothetical protein
MRTEAVLAEAAANTQPVKGFRHIISMPNQKLSNI